MIRSAQGAVPSTGQKPVLRVAQLSDTHLFAGREGRLLGWTTWASLAAVLEAVRATEPDLILITGDLSQDGTPESYQNLRKLFGSIGVPCYWIPGNHDQSREMDALLDRPPFHSGKHFLAGGWLFLLADSQVPGETFGTLTEATLAGLDVQLREHPGIPALVALHHPPLPVGSRWLDEISLRGPEAFLSLIARHPQVRLVLSGHVHQDVHQQWGGVDVYCTRSTCIQFARHSEDFALDPCSPPGFRLLELFPDGTHVSRVVPVAYQGTLDLAAAGY